MPRTRTLNRVVAALAFAVGLSCGRVEADPPQGQLNNCSGTVGVTASAVVFPSTGTGPPAPTRYLLIQNTHVSQDLWFDVRGTAVTASPSYHLTPTSAFLFDNTGPIPTAVSVIGSGAGTTYTCWYQ